MMEQPLTCPDDRSKKRTDYLIVAILFCMAVLFRLLPWQHVYDGGKVYFYDQDCYVRFRKILVYLDAFPATFVYDYFQGFPQGTGVISPPTMEYLIAAFALPFRAFSSLLPLLERFTALLPPLLGGLTAAALYGFLKPHFNRIPAVIASLYLAFATYHVDATCLGRFDNEMTEPLLLLVVCRLYCGTYDEGKENDNRRWIATGLASALYLLFWRGALFPLSIIGLDLACRIFSARDSRDRIRALSRSGAVMYLTIAGIMALVCYGNIWGTRHLFSYSMISNFHVALFGATALFFPLFGGLLGRQAPFKRVYLLLAVAGMAVMPVVFREEIIQGVKVVIGGNPWLDSISQYQRGFSHNIVFGYGIFVFLCPLVLLLLRSRVFRNLPLKRFILIWTVLIFGAAMARLRFAMYLDVSAAIMAGMIAFFMLETRTRGIMTAAAVSVVFLLQVPTWAFLLKLYRTGVDTGAKGDIEDAMVWMSRNTPAAGDAYRPSVQPAYGVLARWDYGGYIESIARRPSIATGYGTETYGMEEVARFFLCGDEAEMKAILQKNRVRYIIVGPLQLRPYAALLGDERVLYTNEWNQGLRKPLLVPTEEFFRLISSRLLIADGSLASANFVVFKQLEGMRLVYESRTPAKMFNFPWEIKKIKIFEYRRGATLVVKGTPGTVVKIVQTVETNQGRRFNFQNAKPIGENGATSFSVPYKQKAGPDSTGAVGPLEITDDAGKRTVQVSNDDVEQERTLNISLI